jgi:predicted transcriptional regulator
MIGHDEKLIESEIKKLVPLLGKAKAERLKKAYLLGDEDTKKRIFEIIDTVKAAMFSDSDLRDTLLIEPPPKSVATSGNLRLGNVIYGKKKMYPATIDSDSLLTHMGIFGSSGYGKTNISLCMIKQLSDNNIPVIIFDFSKRNYKDLLATDLRDRVDIFTIGRDASPFKFNPLKPPKGVQLSQWIKEFASIFDHAYWLLGGGRHVILKALDNVYKENKNPMLTDIKEWLAEYSESSKMPSRERNWFATAERPLESLCFKELGEVFNCVEGIKPSEFFKPGRITILELDALDTNDKTFLIEITLQWIRDWLVVGGRKEELVGTIILEEAHHVLNREKSKKLGAETVMDLIFREIRELGMGVIYIDQHPSMVSYPALGNTSIHIYMNLGLDTKQSSDILDASNMLGLDYDEQGGYIRKLPIGHGFMLCRTSKFPNSFLVEFDKFDFKKGSVTDNDIMEFMKGKFEVEEPERPKPEPGTTRTEKMTESRPISDLTESRTIKKEEKKVSMDPKNVPMTKIQEMNENDWDVIKSIGNGSGSFSSQIYKNLKISGTVFNRRIEKMIDIGLVEMRKAKIRKNRLNYYYLTDVGMDVFYTRYGIEEELIEVSLEKVLEMFNMAGWKFQSKEDSIELNIGGKKANIIIVKTQDREIIRSDLVRNRYFLCASDQIKNMVIQESARRAREGKTLTLFISTINDFEDKGEFERIEFD